MPIAPSLQLLFFAPAFAALTVLAAGGEPAPQPGVRTTIAVTPAMLEAKLVKTGPGEQRSLQLGPRSLVPECTSHTPPEQACAYLVEEGREPSATLPRMHAPIDPANAWWPAVKQHYLHPPSGITDCEQVSDRKCVSLHDTADPLAWKRAWIECGAICTIVVKPGIYEVSYYDAPWIVKREDVHVIGVSGADGAKPVIRGKLTQLKKAKSNSSGADASTPDKPRYAYPSDLIGWRETNKNLTLENLALERCGECLSAGSRSANKQILRLIDVDMRWCRGHCIMLGWEPAGQEDDEIYIHGGEYAYGGANHVVYLDRTLYQEVVGATIHSPGTLHAIKAIGITINLIGNVFSSVKPDGSAQASPGLHEKHDLQDYTGSAPLSLIACQRGVIAYNSVIWRYNGWDSGGSPAIRQPRKAIGGCDLPLAPDLRFWQRVKAQGTHYPDNIANPLALPMYWYANRFVLLAQEGPPGNPNRHVKTLDQAYAIRNQSTHPVQSNATDRGDWKPYPVEPPPGWVERAYDFIVGNCFENFLPDNVRSGSLTSTMKQTDGSPIDPGERQWLVGENTCRHLAPRPAWFPDRLPVMTRGDYEAGALDHKEPAPERN